MKPYICNIYWDYVPAVCANEACALVEFPNNLTAYVVGSSWRAVYHVACNLTKTNDNCLRITMFFGFGFAPRVVYNAEEG